MTTLVFSTIASGTTVAFDPAIDVLLFDSVLISAAQVVVARQPDGTGVSFRAGGKIVFLTPSVNIEALTPANIMFADSSLFAVGNASAAAGDADANTINGTAGRDYLDGLGGADTMRGGAGGDTYVVDNAGDLVDENWPQQIDLIGVSSSGVQGNLGSADPSVSANGRFVAFSSDATNLVAGDTNLASDIFLKDTVTGEVRRVSTDASGAQVSGNSYGSALSADGQLVAFTSTSAGLVPGGGGSTPAVYVKNMFTGAIQRASADTAGNAANAGSSSASLSADGRYVLFESVATNLVGSDGNGASDVFVKDLQTGAIVRASTSAAGVEGNLASNSAKFTPDGRYVVFASSASNLVANDTNGRADIFVKDLQTGAIQRASVGATGTEGVTDSAAPSISADGRYVAFETTAPLLASDTNGLSDIYVKDLLTGALVLASTNFIGQPNTSGSSRGAALSADGAYVAFESSSSQIISFDSNQTVDVFVRSLQAGTTQRVPTTGFGLQTPYAGATVPALAAFSADGGYLVFQSRNPNLVSSDANGSYDVYRVANPFVLQSSPAGAGDQVLSSVTYTLPANVEDLVLTGTSAINGTGNTLANRIVGNDADNVLYGGGAGGSGGGMGGGGGGVNETLIGGGGNDTLDPGPSLASMLYGGSGDDSYFVYWSENAVIENPGEGIDSVLVHHLGNYVAPDNVENVSLWSAISQGGGNLAGNALDNVVTGSLGPNRIDGGAGADTLVGGGDGDTYVVDNLADIVNETLDTAIDTLEASVSRTLESTIEHLVLSGSDSIDGAGNALSNRVTGNSAANRLYGGDSSDRLIGNGGNDTLDGGAALDWMAGGSGDDTYTVDTRLPGFALAFTGEAGEYISAGLTHYYTGADGTFDALTLDDMNSDGQIDQLTIRFLSPGLAHFWHLRFAADKAGRNLAPGDYADTRTSAFIPGHPMLDLTGDGRGGQAYVGSFSIRELEVDYSTWPYRLVRFSASFEERFGNGALAFRGVVSFNGNGSLADQIIEAANDGNDTAQSSLSYVLPVNVENLALTGGSAIDGAGNAVANALTGNAANNRLDGMEGDDTLDGGDGNDTLAGNQGSDQLLGGSGDDILQGGKDNDRLEGGDGFDTLIGGDGNDVLAGMNQGDSLAGGNGDDFLGGGKGLDILDGGEGNDTLVGGLGSDTLIGGNGIDTADYSGSAEALAIDLNLVGAQVVSLLQATESLSGIENLLGGAFNDLITGNALNNLLAGNAANDTLAGGDGFDTIDGGDGDDNLSGMNQGDVINGGNGNDLLGGGKGQDMLDGGEGDDTLQGGLGTDVLTGGNGIDKFVFSTALDGVINVDTLTDFISGTDQIQISAITFGAFAAQVGQTIGLGPNLTYNAATGALAYDADGAGAVEAISFAVLGSMSHPAAPGNDFVVVA